MRRNPGDRTRPRRGPSRARRVRDVGYRVAGLHCPRPEVKGKQGIGRLVWWQMRRNVADAHGRQSTPVAGSSDPMAEERPWKDDTVDEHLFGGGRVGDQLTVASHEQLILYEK